MRKYKEKDKRSEEILEMLDFYYDAEHPIESLVSPQKIDELITILREEYGIFYAPKETHSLMNTMEQYRMDICRAIGIEKVWCWSTTIDEVRTLKHKYDDLVEYVERLKETHVIVPRERYQDLIKKTSQDENTDLDLLFKALKRLEYDANNKRWGKHIWLKSSIKKEEDSYGTVHNSVEVYIYIYNKLKGSNITESYRYTVRRDGSGSLLIVCYNPFQKVNNFDIDSVLNYIKDRCEEMYKELKETEDNESK